MEFKKRTIITHEFGILTEEGKSLNPSEKELPKKAFENLWNHILSIESASDADIVMSVHCRNGRRYIKTGRYIGTIQTKDGTIIEVLPKIYIANGDNEKSAEICRNVFLNMLKHFSDPKARSFQNASLDTKKGFPILETYISNYVSAVETLIGGGLRKNYSLVSENQKFLKGKLNINKQITANLTNKTRFAIEYQKYIEDIPQNRIIVTTLQKLYDETSSLVNKSRITKLLNLLSEIPKSNNVERDLNIALGSDRLFSQYNLILTWSSQFLLNKGFTAFSGNFINQSLLFQAEKLFEQFVAYLFKKYAPTYQSRHKSQSQNQRYFLVDKHDEQRKMFRLKPDIVVETDKNDLNYECVIIDTKWKAIDSSKVDKNYLIDIKDMYQLYAYGHKYGKGKSPEMGYEVIPKLVLLYPYSEKFTEELPQFIYDDIKDKVGLSVMVVPFDLTATTLSFEGQVHSIIKSLDVELEKQPVFRFYQYDEDSSLPIVADDDEIKYISAQQTEMMLVGCYKPDNYKHYKWILDNKLYNIRLSPRRNGSLTKSGKIFSASRLLLFNPKDLSDYKVFSLDPKQHIIANQEMMKKRGYPLNKKSNDYILFVIRDEIETHPEYNVEELYKEFAPQCLKRHAPFFVPLNATSRAE